MPILHMTAGDWMRCLDAHYVSATYFDNAVEFYRQNLELQPMENIRWSEEQIVSQQCHPRRSCLFSTGGHRIWHRKAKRWTRKLSGFTYESSGSESASLRSNSITHRQTELVEAVIGHGLLRDVDLSLLVTDYSPGVDGESTTISGSTGLKASDLVTPSARNTNEVDVSIEGEGESEWCYKARAKSAEAVSDENWIWRWLDHEAISAA